MNAGKTPSPSPGPVTPGIPLGGSANDAGFTEAGLGSVVKANNDFAFTFYSEIKDSSENVFFSPYSISTALAMTYEGARGQTASEMADVFGFPEDASVRRPAYARFYNMLNPANAPYVLRTANALWAQQDYQFLPEYFDAIGDYYMGKVTNLDFVTKTEESRVTINTWVEGQTNDRIKDLIPVGVLDAYTRLVLTNAIYFKGKWAHEFNPEYTYDSTWWDMPQYSAVAPKTAEMMHKSDIKFNYSEDDIMQVLELPYKGDELSMLVLLPKLENGGDPKAALTAVESSLSSEKLSQLRGSLRSVKLPVTLPKFKFETKSMLADTLKKMGMPTAFVYQDADFSGMDGSRELYIGEVIHQAFVEVNEEGTEAAAATAVIMVAGSAMPMQEFTADHPFVFLIQERLTGAILFMGRVMDPTASN